MHKSVLLKEVIEGLSPKAGDIVIDGTLGDGGHSKALCEAVGGKLTIVGIDLDSGSLNVAKENLEGCQAKIYFEESNYRYLDKILDKLEIEKVDGIIIDLGLSSRQLEFGGRGFSFQKDEPLLMTFKSKPTEEDLTAHEIVNKWDEENIADIIYGYGEDRYAKKIAKAIVEKRKEKEIKTTGDLVAIIKKILPRKSKINPATKTFQAFRIAVNDEFLSLKEGIEKGFERLKDGGRMAIISFQSIDDREVKKFYKTKESNGEAILINKKVIQPEREEIKNNPRARSAKLRILEKIKN